MMLCNKLGTSREQSRTRQRSDQIDETCYVCYMTLLFEAVIN